MLNSKYGEKLHFVQNLCKILFDILFFGAILNQNVSERIKTEKQNRKGDNMTVKRRGNKYHYRFMVNGQSYSGVCENCTTVRDAEAYEKKQKALCP